jgi:hypothetical protein
MEGLKEEISRTRSEIETTEQLLQVMFKDRSVNLGRLIETNRKLKELAAYLTGLEFQSNRENSAGQINPSERFI